MGYPIQLVASRFDAFGYMAHDALVNDKDYQKIPWAYREGYLDDAVYPRWEFSRPRYATAGDVIDGIRFLGNKLYDDDYVILAGVAPGVVTGSFLEFEGSDDGTRWIWRYASSVGKVCADHIETQVLQRGFAFDDIREVLRAGKDADAASSVRRFIYV